MSLTTLIVQPDGSYVGLESADAQATARQFVRDFIDRLPEAFHTLDHYEVWHADDFHGLEVNLAASKLIGLDLSACHPLCGPIIIHRLPEGQDNVSERAHQQKYFGLQPGDLEEVPREATVDYLLHRTEEVA